VLKRRHGQGGPQPFAKVAIAAVTYTLVRLRLFLSSFRADAAVS